MEEAVPASKAPRASRLDRRKARTRQALIDAAARLIAEGRGDRASIAEITRKPTSASGSFYNHFDSRKKLFETAPRSQLGQAQRPRPPPGHVPAERFAVGTRIGRLGWTDPDIAGFLTALDALDIPGGLAPRALRDIEAGRRRAGSPCPMPRSRSVRRPEGCSGCCGCADGTLTASRRPRSTSSPRPSCVCSASLPTKPPVSPPSRSLPLRPGNQPPKDAGQRNPTYPR